METPPSPQLLGALNITWYDMTWYDMIWYYIGRPGSATSPAAGYLGYLPCCWLPRQRVLGCASGQHITHYTYMFIEITMKLTYNCNDSYIVLLKFHCSFIVISMKLQIGVLWSLYVPCSFIVITSKLQWTCKILCCSFIVISLKLQWNFNETAMNHYMYIVRSLRIS